MIDSNDTGNNEPSIKNFLSDNAKLALEKWPWIIVLIVVPLVLMAVFVLILFLAAITSDIFQLGTEKAWQVNLGGGGWATLLPIVAGLGVLVGFKINNKDKTED